MVGGVVAIGGGDGSQREQLLLMDAHVVAFVEQVALPRSHCTIGIHAEIALEGRVRILISQVAQYSPRNGHAELQHPVRVLEASRAILVEWDEHVSGELVLPLAETALTVPAQETTLETVLDTPIHLTAVAADVPTLACASDRMT